jgi:hypothetical protein
MYWIGCLSNKNSLGSGTGDVVELTLKAKGIKRHDGIRRIRSKKITGLVDAI